MKLPLLLCLAVLSSPETPGEPQQRPVALVGATIHPVTSEPIENGVLLFDDGKIIAVGAEAAVPTDAERIDVSGKHIYPGMFDAMTNLGLVEINAVRATRDQSETGDLNPNVKAYVAFNPDSEHVPVTRSNGVLLALTAPSGGLISGKSGVMQLDGWTYEDMTLLPDAGMHVDWPRISHAKNWLAKGANDSDENEKLKELEQVFRDARAYQKSKQGKSPRMDLRWESMLDVLDGKLPLIASADDLIEIQSAVAFAARHNVKLIIYGGYDAPLCASLLKKHDVPVIIGGVHRLPERRSDPYGMPFTLPQRLREAGVRFCISGAGRFGASQVRNLPYHAAVAAAFGLPYEEAFKAVTLYPAEILGVSDRVGSLEVSKDATFIVTDGDPLETTTAVEAAFIQGRRVDLMDRHKRLWKKYEEKYRRLGLDGESAEVADGP